MFRNLIATTVILGALITAPAAIAESESHSSVRVSYGDLDLSREAGARTLLERIKSASRRVCGPQPSPRHIANNASYQACYRHSVSQAVAAIDSPRLSALLDTTARNRQVASR